MYVYAFELKKVNKKGYCSLLFKSDQENLSSFSVTCLKGAATDLRYFSRSKFVRS